MKKNTSSTIDERSYSAFQDTIVNEILAANLISTEAIENMIAAQVPGRWEIHDTDDGRLFALDVKGYGSNGSSEEIESFWNDWNKRFLSMFNLDLIVSGRSGGWWGFTLKDLFDNFWKVLDVNDKNLRKLYLRHIDEDYEQDYPDDIAFDAFDEISEENVNDYIVLDRDFVDAIGEFEKSVTDTSNEWDNGRRSL